MNTGAPDLFSLEPGLIERGAEISPCGRYRYALWRVWDKTKPRLLYIMLNPSTADAERDDATIRVCMDRARRLGYGRIRVANLFNYRATDPAELIRAADPVGPEADGALCRAVQGADLIIAAWGSHGSLRGYKRPRCEEALSLLAYDLGLALHALRLTREGQPCHPLRIPYDVPPALWMNRALYLATPRA